MTLIPEIDTSARVAHGDCAAVAPQAFRVDDVAVVVGVAPDDVLLEAARACPAGAIVLVDSDSGEESTRVSVDPVSPRSASARQRRASRGRLRRGVCDVRRDYSDKHRKPPEKPRSPARHRQAEPLLTSRR